MTSQAGQEIIKIHIFPNISRSKDSQAMNSGQLIEYFLEKSYTKYDYLYFVKEKNSGYFSKYLITSMSIFHDEVFGQWRQGRKVLIA